MSFWLIALAIVIAIALDILLVWRMRGGVLPARISRGLERIRAYLKEKASGTNPIRSERTVGFIVGCAFLVAGYIFLSTHAPVLELHRLSDWLNDLLLIDVANRVNTVVGGGFLLLGVALVALSLRPARYPDPKIAIVPFGRPRRRIVFLLAASLLVLSIVLWQLSTSEPPTSLPYLWMASLLLLSLAAFRFDRHQGRQLRLSADRWDALILSALVLGGLALGAYRLTSIPFSMVGDEGRFFEVASSIATSEFRPSLFGAGVYSYPLASSFYQALVMRLVGVSLFGWRFASVIVAVLGAVPTYLFAREAFDRRMAILSGALMISMPFFLAIERLGYNNSQSILPVALAVFLVYTGLRKVSVFYLTLGGIAAGFGFYTYTAGRLGIVLVLGFLAIAFVARRKNRNRAGLALLAAALLGFAVTVAPHQYYGFLAEPSTLSFKAFESLFPNLNYAQDIYELPDLVREFDVVKLGGNSFFIRLDLYIQLIFRGLVRTGLALFHPDVAATHYIDGPLPGPLAGALFGIGFALALAGLRQFNFQVVLLWLLSGLLLLSALNTFPPRPLHVVPVIPALSLLAALGLAILADFVRMILPKQRRVYAIGFAAAGLVVVSTAGIYRYFVSAQERYLPNIEDLIAFTGLNLESSKDLIYVAPSDEFLEFEPWALIHLPNRAHFENIDVQTLGLRRLSDRSAFTIFFEEENQDEVGAWIAGSLGDRAELVTHDIQGRSKRVLSYSFDPAFESAEERVTSRLPDSTSVGLGVAAIASWAFALVVVLRRWYSSRRELKLKPDPKSADPLDSSSVTRLTNQLKAQREKLNSFLESLHDQITSPSYRAQITRDVPRHRRKLIAEVALVALVIILFSTEYLDMDPQQLLPGQEYGVLSYPDQVLHRTVRDFRTFPLWNPYVRSGFPYLGDPFSHPFNPISTIPVLTLGVTNGYKLAVFASMLLAGIGMWVLGRSLGFQSAARLWIAILYAINGQAIARFIQGQYLFIFGYAWIPLVFSGLVLSLKTKSRRYYVLTALALAMLYFTGTSYYTFYLALILAALGALLLIAGARYRSPGKVWSRIRPIVFIGALTVGLIAVQLLPALDMRPHILKPDDPDLRFSIPLREAVTSFISTSVERPNLLLNLPPQEFYAYIGIFPLLTMILAVPAAIYGGRRKIIAGFALLLALTLTWSSIGFTPFAPAYQKAEFLHQFRYTSRTLVIGVLALLTLAGFGVSWIMRWLRHPPDDNQGRKIVSAALLILMIASALMAFRENLRFVSLRPRNLEADRLVEYVASRSPYITDASIPVSTGWHVAAASIGLRYWDAWYGFDFFPPVGQSDQRFRDAPNYLIQSLYREVHLEDAELLKEVGDDAIYEIGNSLPYAFAVPLDFLLNGDEQEIARGEVIPLVSTELSPNRIRVENTTTTGPGWVVVRSSYYPGWTVTVDGESGEVAAVGEYIGTPIDPDASAYEFSYRSSVVNLGIVVTLYAILVCLLLLAEPWLKETSTWQHLQNLTSRLGDNLRRD